MKRLGFLITFIFLTSFSVFAQTITWNSAHPAPNYPVPVNLEVGTSTYSGGINSGSIILTERISSCSVLGTCTGGDSIYGYAEYVTTYDFHLNFYDADGNPIPAMFTRTFYSTVSRCSPFQIGVFDYFQLSWTTAPGSPPIAYVEEVITEYSHVIWQDPNEECYYDTSSNPPYSEYPLGSPFAGIFLGPQNNPQAVGTNNNDDYTNKSLLGNIVGTTTTTSQIISFVNTVRNKDTITDSAIITAPSVPSGFTVEASANCATYTNITGSGSITISGIPGTSNVNFCVRITAPSGINTFTPFSTILRATSVNDPTKTNDTIDRIYSGYITTSKSAVITNTTGVGGANDPVPGAEIQYTVNYQNIANIPYGTGNYDLFGANFLITEDGNLAPNNWASYTTHVAGSASDSLGGIIAGDSVGSNVLTDLIPSLAPQQSGTFIFRRRIN